MFGASLFGSARRFAFEIDDDPVVAPHQHLAQVIVAVMARLESLHLTRASRIDAREQGARARE